MEIRRGIPVSPGIAIGEVFLLEAEGVRIHEHFIAERDVEQEVGRLQKAMDQALEELETLAGKVSSRAGSKIAEIFSAHAGMLKDEYFRPEFFDRIRNKKYTAEFAVSRTMRQWRKVFQSDPFLATRVPDLDDLERRLLRNLLGARREELASLSSEVILVAHDLSPSQTASVDPQKVKGIAIDGGGPTGHTAIIASALGIPAVVGLGSVTAELSGGDAVIVDGSHGVVIIHPDMQTLASYEQRRTEVAKSEIILLEELRDQPAETLDGRRVHVLAQHRVPARGAARRRARRRGHRPLPHRVPVPDERPRSRPSRSTSTPTWRPSASSTAGPSPSAPWTWGRTSSAGAMEPTNETNPFLGRRSIRYCLRPSARSCAPSSAPSCGPASTARSRSCSPW